MGADRAVDAVVQDQDQRGRAVLGGGGQFLTGHLKITVTREAQRQSVGLGQTGRNRRRHSVSHSA